MIYLEGLNMKRITRLERTEQPSRFAEEIVEEIVDVIDEPRRVYFSTVDE